MENGYSISDSVNVGGNRMGFVDVFAQKYVGGYYMYAFALIVVLSLVVLYYVFHRCKETFSAVPNMRNAFGIERLSTPVVASECATDVPVEGNAYEYLHKHARDPVENFAGKLDENKLSRTMQGY